MQRDNPIQLFKRYLKAKGLNVTRSRERILEEVFKTHEHFDATELWAKLRDTTISLSTIYRTLGLLVDSGLVREVDLGDAHIHYEHIFGRRHHEHLICVGCGKILEFFDRALEEKVLEMVERFDFQHHSHNLQIFGLCQDCQEKGAKL